jgi:undecaprenyl-phosphate 4-deoxy-4-formamido-L-arabinose transferase
VPTPEHLVSVVVPVYRGEAHLADLVDDITPLTSTTTTAAGHRYRVVETLLVHDCGPDRSADVIRVLSGEHEWVRPIWLSRNYGQHAATIAGMASAGGEWIVTLDEDGQHDPADIASLLDAALREQSALVYAKPVNSAPHGPFRNVTSVLSKRMVNLLSGGGDASRFHSFRLVLGEHGRSMAAYAGHGIYLDVALGWIAGAPSTAPVTLRDEGERQSGYSVRSLLSHFWRMVVTSGTRGLRLVSVLGAAFALVGVALAVWLVVNRLLGGAVLQGWTSLMVALLLCTGVILFFLGVIAEYVGVAVNMAMGRPLYLITSDPATSPLSRDRPVESRSER